MDTLGEMYRETIVVTGASGFLGKSLVQKILELPNDDRFFVLLYYKYPIETYRPNIKCIRCNLLETTEFNEVLSQYKPTTLVHLAWFVTHNEFWCSKENLRWLTASLHLFEQFCAHGGEKFISTGSVCEYDLSQSVIDEQTTPLKPDTLYGQCKVSLCHLLTAFRNAHFPTVSIIWPRIAWFFGENEPPEKLFSSTIRKIKNDELVSLQGRHIARPYAHVKYVGEVLHQCLSLSNDCHFTVSGVRNLTLEFIVKYMAKILGKSYSIEYVVPSEQASKTLQHYSMMHNTLKTIAPSALKDTFNEDLECFVHNKTG
jgi:nucleoside-diphosphate-sugar epimerase